MLEMNDDAQFFAPCYQEPYGTYFHMKHGGDRGWLQAWTLHGACSFDCTTVFALFEPPVWNSLQQPCRV